MDANDFQGLTKMLAPIFEYFDRPATPDAVKVYFVGLAEFELADIRRVIPQLLQTCEFMPKVPRFIALLKGTDDERAEKAFALFAEAVTKGGYMKSVYSADACLIAAVKRLFGSWSRACSELPAMSDPMFANFRKSFVMAYKTAMREGCTEHYLPGRSEAENISNQGLTSRKLAGVETFQAQVVCIAHEVSLRDAEFSATTGRLCDATILALPGMAETESPRQIVSRTALELSSRMTM